MNTNLSVSVSLSDNASPMEVAKVLELVSEFMFKLQSVAGLKVSSVTPKEIKPALTEEEIQKVADTMVVVPMGQKKIKADRRSTKVWTDEARKNVRIRMVKGRLAKLDPKSDPEMFARLTDELAKLEGKPVSKKAAKSPVPMTNKKPNTIPGAQPVRLGGNKKGQAMVQVVEVEPEDATEDLPIVKAKKKGVVVETHYADGTTKTETVKVRKTKADKNNGGRTPSDPKVKEAFARRRQAQ